MYYNRIKENKQMRNKPLNKGEMIMTWKDKLNKKELKHLKETDTKTLMQIKENVKHQDKMEFPCWDCVSIGQKLGIEIKLSTFHKE